MALTPQYSPEGTARFMNNEQVDFHAASNNIAPATDVLRARKIKEATIRVLQSYGDGYSHTEAAPKPQQNPEEAYKQRAVAYIQAASRNLTDIRQHKVDTNWNLEHDRMLPRIDIGGILKKTLKLITGDDRQDAHLRMPKRKFLSGVSERELLKAESAIGGALFGDIPAGVSRDFFNLDGTTWIWHQESTENGGQVTTIRYEVQDTGILKAQNGAQYSYLEGRELQDFTTAVNMYYDQVMATVYGHNTQNEQVQKQTDYTLAA
jgi:hypothetical protein